MRHNISSGRLRHYVQLTKVDTTSTDEYGVPNGVPELVFDARADVKVVSGRQMEQYQTALTEQMITALLWFDHRVSTDLQLVWEGRTYDVVNIQPSSDDRSMIVTGKLVGDFKFSDDMIPTEPEGVQLTTESGTPLVTESGEFLVRDL